MKRFTENKTMLDMILRIVLVVMIIGVIASPLTGTMFTYLSEDDFSYESGGMEGAAQYQSSVLGSFYKTVNIYKNQQGCYTPMFLDHLIRPYTRFGLPGFHMAMFLYVASFIASLVMISFVLGREKTFSLAVLLVAVMSVFAMSETKLDVDIIFWHTETLGFTLMLAFMFLGLGFSILSFRSKGAISIVYIVISSILAFLASGASLTVTAVNCSVFLAVLILDYKELLARKVLAVPFISGFIGALINAVAPGNFVRADESAVPGHETLLDGLRDTFSCLFKAYPKAVDIVFIFAALALLALGIIYKAEVFKDGITHARMGIIILGVFLLQYFEVFPAAYGSHYDEMSEHLLIEHLIITRLTLIFVVISLAQWIRENFIEKAASGAKIINILKYACAVAALLVLVIPASRAVISDSFTARTFRDLKSGTMVRVYRIREYQLSYFELAEDGSDAILYTPWDTTSESLPGIGITADSEWIVNRSAANMFGLHTTTILVP